MEALSIAEVWARWVRRRSTAAVFHGRRFETIALRNYKKRGYRLVRRNWRVAGTEIDLVLQSPDRDALVLVEVRGRRMEGGAFRPRDTLSFAKKQRLFRALRVAEHGGAGHTAFSVRLELCEILERPARSGWRWRTPREISIYPLSEW